MKLIRLQAFSEVMNSGTVTEAARRLKCSQPRISRLIAELEDEVGFPLFTREKQRLTPTAEGTRFFKEIEKFLSGFEEIGKIVKDIRMHRESSLRILTQSHFANGVLDHALGEFSLRYPDIRYYLEIRPRVEVEAWLSGRQFDLAFSPLPAKHPLTRNEHLLTVRLLAAMHRSHPLSAKPAITIEDFSAGPIIALTRGRMLRQRLEDLFRKAGLEPDIRVETPSVLSACQLARQGIGITLTDPFIAHEIEDEDFVVRPISPAYKIAYGVLYLRQTPPKRLAREFIEVVRKVAQDIAAASGGLCAD